MTEDLNTQDISLCTIVCRSTEDIILLDFSTNSKAKGSKLLENLEEIIDFHLHILWTTNNNKDTFLSEILKQWLHNF